MTIYLILATAFGAALVPGMIMFVAERRERDRGQPAPDAPPAPR